MNISLARVLRQQHIIGFEPRIEEFTLFFRAPGPIASPPWLLLANLLLRHIIVNWLILPLFQKELIDAYVSCSCQQSTLVLLGMSTALLCGYQRFWHHASVLANRLSGPHLKTFAICIRIEISDIWRLNNLLPLDIECISVLF